MTERPRTPPPKAGSSGLNMDPEQLKRVELNRLKAKAKQREREEQHASSSSAPNANNKRTLNSVVPADSHSATAPLKRDSRLGKYFDYDLSKMANSKGGFLVDDGKEIDDQRRAKELQRERERAKQSLEPAIHVQLDKNPKCRECESIDLDQTYLKVLGCMVCHKCKNELPEKYSLLTKTECKTDYLLTDPELRDHEIMPHILKPNPHQSTYSNMMLFCRYQVEEFAWKKWGSPEALDAEWDRRMQDKRKLKNKKFEQGLKELRRKTREGVWQRRKDEEHHHVFSSSSHGKQVCHSCGFTIEVEEF